MSGSAEPAWRTVAPGGGGSAFATFAPRVAYQGAPGAFSDEAIGEAWGGRAEAVPTPDFEATVRALRSGAVDHALLPLENSRIGRIEASWAAIGAADDLVRVREVTLAVRPCLLALPGATLDTVRRVASHPAALAQCTRFLARHPALVAVPAYDTAGAAADVARRGDPAAAAIASRGAAARYGLVVLAVDIQDDPQNVTRFVVLARRGTGLAAGERA